MKRVIQIVGVVSLLVISVIIRNTAKAYISETYDLLWPYLISSTLVIFIYQLCYWLIEKYDDLVLLTKKIPYFIGFIIVMLGIDLVVCYIMFMVIPIRVSSFFMDPTINAITSFLISTLIGNYILKRLLIKQSLDS